MKSPTRYRRRQHPVAAVLMPASVLTASLCILLVMSSQASATLREVAKLPQWPGVSQLIAYNNRIWFVNSEPYKDTNVADIYSHAPGTSSVHYERSLFSQDAGTPVVHEGLLFWPFEDPRRSAGSGEYAVTDGTTWDWRIMQSGSVMHVHAMGVCDNQLVAVTGSWNGQLHRLEADDVWQLQFEYPAGTASFSRLVSVGQFNRRCLVGASAKGQDETKLLSFEDNSSVPIAGWPKSDRVEELTSHKSTLYAFADSGNGRELLRFDGERTKPLLLPDRYRPRALYSDGETLWLVTSNTSEQDDRGGLWTIDDDGDFTQVETFSAPPIDITGHGNQIFVGTYSSDGGSLWAYTDPTRKTTESRVDQTTVLAPRTDAGHTLDERLVQTLHDQLLNLAEDPDNSAGFARELRRKISRHPERSKPEFGAALTRLLSVRLNGKAVTMFTQEPVSYQDLVHWYLICALASNGHGRIEPEFINSTQTISSHSSGKLFNPVVAAIVAVGWLKQQDPATVNALMKRLNNDSDPAWLKSDVIGALTAITEQRFAYDSDAWNLWWQNQ